jgi:hypothetical protein
VAATWLSQINAAIGEAHILRAKALSQEDANDADGKIGDGALP